MSLYHFTHVFQHIRNVVTLRQQLIVNREVNQCLHRLRNHVTVDIINKYLGPVPIPVAARSKA